MPTMPVKERVIREAIKRIEKQLMEKRVCKVCGVEKDLESDFRAVVAQGSGKKYYGKLCKECANAEQRLSKKTNYVPKAKKEAKVISVSYDYFNLVSCVKLKSERFKEFQPANESFLAFHQVLSEIKRA